MKGFAHFFWGCSSFLFTVLTMTAIITSFNAILFIILLYIAIFIAVCVGSFASRKEKEKSQLKGDAPKAVKKRKQLTAIYQSSRLTYIIITSGTMFGLMLLQRNYAIRELVTFRSGFFFIGFFTAFLGASIPDMDLMVGIKVHRSAFSHSALMPGAMAVYCIFIIENALIPVCMIVLGITIGAMSHLFCDMVTDGLNVWQSWASLAKWSSSPGDIRRMREKSEQPYLFINGVILLFYSLLLIFRIMIVDIPFLPIWSYETLTLSFTGPSLMLFSFSIFLLVFPLILMVAFFDWKGLEKEITRN